MKYEYNNQPICPHCDHEERDAWEIDFTSMEGEAEIECGNCGEPYFVHRHVSITYSTIKATEVA